MNAGSFPGIRFYPNPKWPPLSRCLVPPPTLSDLFLTEGGGDGGWNGWEGWEEGTEEMREWKLVCKLNEKNNNKIEKPFTLECKKIKFKKEPEPKCCIIKRDWNSLSASE